MDSGCLNGCDSLKGSCSSHSSLLSSWLYPSSTVSLVSQPFAIFHKFKNFLSINTSDINTEMENIELKCSTSCPADISKSSQLSFFCYINHQENFQEPVQSFTQFQNIKTSHNSRFHPSFLMKNYNNINPIGLNLYETPSLAERMDKISMDLTENYFQLFSFVNEKTGKIKYHRKKSTFKALEMDQFETVFPSLNNSSFLVRNMKRSLSSSSLDDIKHLPYDFCEKVKNIILDDFINEEEDTKPLEISTTKINGFGDNSFTTKKMDPVQSANDISCKKAKKRRKNQKRRNRKKKNRDKCKLPLNIEEKLADNHMNNEPKDKAVSVQNDEKSATSTNSKSSKETKKTDDPENNCFISKFFSCPSDDESNNEVFEPQSINWDDEDDDDEDAPINGSLEKEFTATGLFFSNLVSKEPRKIHCEIKFSTKDFLLDSPSNNDFDDEDIWIETPEERELREKMQAMVAKANEDWNAISLPPECNDNDVGIFPMEIQGTRSTRHVQFVEEPIIWFIPDLEE
ncbi:uncharacterized protein LOC113793368 [Dermatophagoides pteronyssinus]|uniref:Uncharacterized protein LOC113793368 n=1 Tax=Dermatophagoides pteronyssinus TaxID=6956 RepID=A0A6P6Y460_DERPT|nr:uncharacterized protein LOC113793368 [Dermatophagoides pteronyssinus]XP_027199190.1 uncharacterized protein LOC113793368 [Dermatophagoides pteronyssinus]